MVRFAAALRQIAPMSTIRVAVKKVEPRNPIVAVPERAAARFVRLVLWSWRSPEAARIGFRSMELNEPADQCQRGDCAEKEAESLCGHLPVSGTEMSYEPALSGECRVVFRGRNNCLL